MGPSRQCGGGGGDSGTVVLVLAHIWVHSQGTSRVTDSRTGSSKLSCSTLQVTGLPSVWLEGIAIKKLVTVYVPGCCPGTRLSLVFASRCDQESSAGGRPSLETQRATGTGSGPSGLSGTSSASALLSGWAADKRKRTGQSSPAVSQQTAHQRRGEAR